MTSFISIKTFSYFNVIVIDGANQIHVFGRTAYKVARNISIDMNNVAYHPYTIRGLIEGISYY